MHTQVATDNVHDWQYVIDLALENDLESIHKFTASLLSNPHCHTLSGLYGGLPRVVQYIKIEGFDRAKRFAGNFDLSHVQMKAGEDHSGVLLQEKYDILPNTTTGG